MLDLNAIVSAAINAAIKEATEPLVTRIAALESANDILHRVQGDRIAALETKLSEANLFAQMTPATITADAFVTHLDQQEWFWRKVADFIDREFDGRGIVSEGRVEELIEEAMDEHTSTYDHDEYDEHIGNDDKHFEGDIEDAVRDALSNMTFDVSIR